MRWILAVFLSFLVGGSVAHGQQEIYPPSKTSYSLSGNRLVNFFNAGLTTNAHKKIMVVGNSTVWNATGYFAEWCNYLSAPVAGTGNVLANLGLTPCTTTISGYQVMDTAGTVVITFTGTTPTGYTVGDLVLSQPTNAGLNTIIGTGIITAIGASTITYTLLSTNTLPVVTAFTSSGGYITNSLVNMGQNGGTSLTVASAIVPLIGTYAKPGDLVIVRGPLINDVRLGACNLACAVSNTGTLYSALTSRIPALTDIAWKTENSLLTTDPGSTGYVSPLGSSAAYTKILYDAVFQAFAALPSRPVVWDNMQMVWTKLGGEYATSAWMADILHPNSTGQTREADADIQILTQVGKGVGISPATLSNPNANTATNGAALNGDASWLAQLRALVAFSPIMTEHAQVDNYASPWSLYPDSVLDPGRYDVVAYGSIVSVATNLVRFSSPTVNGTNPSRVSQNDLIWFLGSGVIQVPSGFSQTAFNSGGTNYTYNLSTLGNIVPSSAYVGQQVAVLRQRSYIINDVAKYQDTVTWSYRHRITVQSSGTNFIRVSFNDTPVSWPNAMTSSDVLELPCGEISLSGASFSNFATYTGISVTGSFAACSGQSGWVFGTHSMESVQAQANYPSGSFAGSESPAALSAYRTWTWPDASGTVMVAPGTGLSASTGTVSSNAAEHMSYQPGLITTIVNTKSVFAKFSKASTVDNLEGSSQSFTCTVNPVVTMYECGTSSTCAAPTTIGTVTVTAAGTVADGTVSNPAITAGDYVAFAISAGTCTGLDISAVAQVHAN